MCRAGRRVRPPLFVPTVSHVLYSFDLDLPIECDDEYWMTEDPEKAFQQPPGLPSRVSYFVWMLKFGNIRAAAIRRIVRRFIQQLDCHIEHYSVL